MPTPVHILCIDPIQLLRGCSLQHLPFEAEIATVDAIEAATEYLRNGNFHLVLVCDSEGSSANHALERIHQTDQRMPVIVCAKSLGIDDAVRLTKLGAFCCLQDAELTNSKLASAIGAAAEHRFATDLLKCGSQSENEPWRESLIGNSRPMRQVAEIIRLIAARRSTVLITGETGTGKEVVAKAIHAASNRSNRVMVAVNCGAIPETLIEAELFGHTKGAFTGATGTRTGRFEQANTSTLFLDEIAELPYDVQAKLLRVLQEREFQRLGSSETVSLDVRVIAAANVDLHEAIATRKFREDLFYRLNVVPLKLPPIRDRKEDIPLLVSHFLRKICRDEDLPGKHISDETLNRLCEYHWPGNVRQIEHSVEMAIALSGTRDTLFPGDFNLPVPSTPAVHRQVRLPDEGLNFDETVGRMERSLLEQALAKANGNKGRAADLLRLKRTTFLAKLKSFDMFPEPSEKPSESDVSLEADSYDLKSASAAVM